MKQVLRLALTLALALGMAASSFAVANPNPKLKSAYRSGHQTPKRKLSKSRHRGAKKIGNKRRTSGLRGRRLTRRQVRDFYRRMLDISVN
jgi:hypothetical protein